MDGLDDDMVALMTKRVYDIAGTARRSLKVYLNGKRIEINSFEDYVNLFIEDHEAPRIFERINNRCALARFSALQCAGSALTVVHLRLRRACVQVGGVRVDVRRRWV